LDTAFLSPPPLGGLGITYDVHLGLIGKRVVHLLLVLIALFSLGVTVESLRKKLYTKVPILCVWHRHAIGRSRLLSTGRGRRLNDDVVTVVPRRLFTVHYCTIVAVSATSDTAGKFAIGQGVLSPCGLTDNRAVSLDTVTTRHYSEPRRWYIQCWE